MQIAIVGSGVAGLVAAAVLSRAHAVTVFEKSAWAGGHVHTHSVSLGGESIPVDSGFIVFNDRAYGQFSRLLEILGVRSRPTSMSFAVRCERTGLEYGGTGLGAVFAQRRNLIRPYFWRLLRDVLRFGRESRSPLDEGDGTLGLRAYLTARGYSRAFIEHYAIPMGSAIWSAPRAAMNDFPARHFVRFFEHHGVLDIRRAPVWRTIVGGSGTYVERLISPFRHRVRLSTGVERVARNHRGVEVTTHGGETARFDRVVIAAHADQALAMLDEPTPAEREVLGALRYRRNDAILHTDSSVMPVRRRAWSSWNYLIPARPSSTEGEPVVVTYYMNLLQGLAAHEPILVTLGGRERVDPAKVLRCMTYEHPVTTSEALAAKQRLAEINGVGGVHYCGAYWGYGFHEDGVKSALDVTRAFGLGLEDLS